MMPLLKLIPMPPGEIPNGRPNSKTRLLELSSELRKVRGQIGFIFQIRHASIRC